MFQSKKVKKIFWGVIALLTITSTLAGLILPLL